MWKDPRCRCYRIFEAGAISAVLISDDPARVDLAARLCYFGAANSLSNQQLKRLCPIGGGVGHYTRRLLGARGSYCRGPHGEIALNSAEIGSKSSQVPWQFLDFELESLAKSRPLTI